MFETKHLIFWISDLIKKRKRKCTKTKGFLGLGRVIWYSDEVIAWNQCIPFQDAWLKSWLLQFKSSFLGDGRSTWRLKHIVPWHPHWETWSSRFLVSTFLIPACGKNVESKAVDIRSLSLHLSLSLSACRIKD